MEKILWRREWQPTPVFLPGKSHGRRQLAIYSPWSCKELDTTEQLSTHAGILFSIVAAPIYVPTNSVRGSLFSTLSPAFIVCRHFDNGHSEQWGWYFIVVLICTSLILSDVKHLFTNLYFFSMSFLEKYMFRSSLHFWVGCLLDIELFEYFGN